MNRSDDTIRRQSAIDAVEKESQVDGAYGYMDTKSIVDLLMDLPSAQPEPKTGKWYIDAEGDVRCTACMTKCLRDDIGINILSNYCPSCGADMRGVDDD